MNPKNLVVSLDSSRLNITTRYLKSTYFEPCFGHNSVSFNAIWSIDNDIIVSERDLSVADIVEAIALNPQNFLKKRYYKYSKSTYFEPCLSHNSVSFNAIWLIDNDIVVSEWDLSVGSIVVAISLNLENFLKKRYNLETVNFCLCHNSVNLDSIRSIFNVLYVEWAD